MTIDKDGTSKDRQHRAQKREPDQLSHANKRPSPGKVPLARKTPAPAGENVQRKRAPVDAAMPGHPVKKAREWITDPYVNTALRGTPLPSTGHGTAAPVQRQRHPANAAAQTQTATDTKRWMNTAMRPDLHPAPALDALQGPGQALPHQDTIQQSFGAHDISGVTAHIGANVRTAAEGIGAAHFASGNAVGLGDGAGLFEAAHEAAHLIQQRGAGSGSGVGVKEDPGREAHADQVANAVVRGQSAEALLNRVASPDAAPAAPGRLERIKQHGGGAPVAVDPAALTELQAWDHLQNILGQLAPVGGIGMAGNDEYEAGDEAALNARLAATRGDTLTNQVGPAMTNPAVGPAAQARHVDPAVVADFGKLIARLQADPKVTNLNAWVLNNAHKILADPGQLLDHVNELREVEARLPGLPAGQTLDLDEAPIPGTAQTADISNPTSADLIEVKTVAAEVWTGQELTGQLAAGFGKFAGAGGGLAAREVVIYASYPEAPRSSGKKGITRSETVDRATGIRNFKLTDPKGTVRQDKNDDYIANHVQAWLATNPAGANEVTRLQIKMENGLSFTWSRGAAGWVRI